VAATVVVKVGEPGVVTENTNVSPVPGAASFVTVTPTLDLPALLVKRVRL